MQALSFVTSDGDGGCLVAHRAPPLRPLTADRVETTCAGRYDDREGLFRSSPHEPKAVNE
jgi:hypothetical protein